MKKAFQDFIDDIFKITNDFKTHPRAFRKVLNKSIKLKWLISYLKKIDRSKMNGLFVSCCVWCHILSTTYIQNVYHHSTYFCVNKQQDDSFWMHCSVCIMVLPENLLTSWRYNHGNPCQQILNILRLGKCNCTYISIGVI